MHSIYGGAEKHQMCDVRVGSNEMKHIFFGVGAKGQCRISCLLVVGFVSLPGPDGRYSASAKKNNG